MGKLLVAYYIQFDYYELLSTAASGDVCFRRKELILRKPVKLKAEALALGRREMAK